MLTLDKWWPTSEENKLNNSNYKCYRKKVLDGHFNRRAWRNDSKFIDLWWYWWILHGASYETLRKTIVSELQNSVEADIVKDKYKPTCFRFIKIGCVLVEKQASKASPFFGCADALCFDPLILQHWLAYLYGRPIANRRQQTYLFRIRQTSYVDLYCVIKITQVSSFSKSITLRAFQ